MMDKTKALCKPETKSSSKEAAKIRNTEKTLKLLTRVN